MRNCLLERMSQVKVLGRISRNDTGKPPEKAKGQEQKW